MKYLTLIRHAKSSWAEAGVPDHNRALNARGQLAAPAIANFLSTTYFGGGKEPALLIPPDHVVASTAVRTVVTAEIFAARFGIARTRLYFDPRLYLASKDTMLDVVRDLDEESRHAVIVGHNPGIHEFCNAVLARAAVPKMPTCTAVLISFPHTFWGLVDFQEAQLIGYITPKALERKFPTQYAGISSQNEDD